MAIASRSQKDQSVLHKAPDAFRTISEVADELDLPQHVLRFWETRFPQIKPMKRGGGRRYYRPDDVDLLRGIKHLLYGEGYTIRGVQRILKDHGSKFVQSVWQAGAPQPKKSAADLDPDEAPSDVLLPVKGEGRTETDSAQTPQSTRRGASPDQTPAITRTVDSSSRPATRAPGAGIAAIREASANLVRQRAPFVESGRVERPVERLGGDEVRRLQAVLEELTECRRLIDAALADKS
jgi:DNA-binding transcriptional MerR regulator